MKKALKGLLIFVLVVFSLLLWDELSRSFYCLGKNKYITVWKTSWGCYIIPGKYYGIIKPSNNYIKTTNTNAITILTRKSLTHKYVVSNDYGKEIEIKMPSDKIRYFNYQNHELFVDAFFKNGIIKPEYDYLMIDIKEGLVVINGIKQ